MARVAPSDRAEAEFALQAAEKLRKLVETVNASQTLRDSHPFAVFLGSHLMTMQLWLQHNLDQAEEAQITAILSLLQCLCEVVQFCRRPWE